MQSQNYLKRVLGICIPIIKQDIWKENLFQVLEQTFKVIILNNILPTEDELENPQEFVYYYFDCIDERKSKTLKNLVFTLMEEIFEKKPDFLEFFVKSLNYIIDSAINGDQININYLKYHETNLSIFEVLRKSSNIIKVYLISLSNSAFQIADRVDLLEDIEQTLKQILNLYLSNSQAEDKEEVLSLFCLFFIYSSDFIFQNNDSFFKKILHTFVELLNQKDIPKVLELQIIFMFEKIITEEKVQIFIKSEIPFLLEIMVNKMYNSEMQEFYSLLRQLFSFCSFQIIETILERFLQQILTLVQTKENDFILGNCLEVLKSLLNLNHGEKQDSLFLKIDQYTKLFLEVILKNQAELFKEPLIDIFLTILKKSRTYLDSFEFFLQNILQIFQNIEAQNMCFQIVLYFIRKFKDKLMFYKNNVAQLIEIILINLQVDDVYMDQNILLLGYLFSLDLFTQDQTVRLYSLCYKQLTSKDQDKQSTYISACVFLKITQMNYDGAQQFLQHNNINLQKFYYQFALILIQKIKASTQFLNKWMNIPITYLQRNIQNITNNLFEDYLLNCLLLNLIQLNQTNLFVEERDQILYILREQFSQDNLYKLLKQIYDKEYDYDDFSDIEEEKLQELEEIGANLGKFPDHTLDKLTNELLDINNSNNFDSFDQMRNIITQLETQQNYMNIYQSQLGEDFQKVIRNTKNLYTFEKDRNYSVRKILKIKRIKNKQFSYINQPKDGKGSQSPQEKISSSFIFYQQIKNYGGDECRFELFKKKCISNFRKQYQ